MGFNCGIVGLPNVGKSTIFNALTSAQAESANYPFCTIDPNTGIVSVPDVRLEILAKVANSKQIIPTKIEFVDIAGLVKGASKGEGLGNQFLGHIRDVDAIIHVVRCFEDSNIVHVNGSVSPVDDIEVIETELMLADLMSVERRIDRVAKTAKGGDKAAIQELEKLNLALECLQAGKMLNGNVPAEKLEGLGLLTSKPVLYLANVSEDAPNYCPDENTKGSLGELVRYLKRRLGGSTSLPLVVVSARVEEEISQLDVDERKAFLEELGILKSGLDRLILAGYNLLNLITFFTVGPKETHAWTCAKGTTAPQAAGKIHTDFEKGFIRAEVIGFDDYVRYGGEVGAKEKGAMRVEGKSYLMQDGDIVHFRFNV
ncbi:MAG: redox-regulated ATPase YchF [Deltaproteobacteria bacterium]|nr:redox-regulated ATPase YchF [Deltaproteobacteria bacterium]